jgi:hypothetical protein
MVSSSRDNAVQLLSVAEKLLTIEEGVVNKSCSLLLFGNLKIQMFNQKGVLNVLKINV